MNMIAHTMLRDPPPATRDSYHALEREYGARNYKPFDVVLTRGLGVWLWDFDGRRYLDCLSAYSAVNQGHPHPRILAALTEQASRLAITSRAFMNDQLPPFYKELCAVTHSHKVLPMNSGAEAVETAQGRAQMGLSRQGRPEQPGRSHRLRQQLPRPYTNDRRIHLRPYRARRVRSVHAGIPSRPLCRPRRARSGDHAQYGRLPGRAHPGRGRGDDSAHRSFQIGA